MRSIIADYEEAKRRCAAYRHMKPSGNYRKDVQRILFSQDRENEISVDELYQTFEWYEAYQIRRSLAALRESDWQFTPSEDREELLYTILGSHLPPTKEILCDFRSGGYRLLGDILMDLDEQNQDTAMRKFKGILKDDTAQMKSMMRGVMESQDYRQTLIRNCKNIICPTIRHYSGEVLEQIDWDDAVMCAEALGKRDFTLEVLPAAALDLVIDRTVPEKKERGESLVERVGRILGLHRVS